MSHSITEEQFLAYEGVKESGVTNMLDTKRVASLALEWEDVEMTSDDVVNIIKHYDELKRLWG